jgi:RNA polymerase sigma-70 factor, ECF subfamily
MTIDNLLVQARSGDQRAYRKIFALKAPLVRGWLLRRGVRGDDLDDHVQTVFFRAFRALHRFEGASGLNTWLYRIAFNVAVNQYRADVSRGRRHLAAATVAPTSYTPAADAKIDAWILLHQLPERLARMVVLRASGLTQTEIGDRLGCVDATVRRGLAEAQRRLSPYREGVSRPAIWKSALPTL